MNKNLTKQTEILSRAISKYEQGAIYSLVNADINTLDWDASNKKSKPTMQDLNALMSSVMADDRKAEIIIRLKEIDVEAIRPLRAVTNGTATQFDKDKLAKLDAEADALRTEFAGL